MLFKIILSVLFCSIAYVAADSYWGYKVYDINAKNTLEKDVLNRLSANENYDFFDLSKIVGKSDRVMVTPADQAEFEAILNKFDIDFVVVNENFGKTVELERAQNNLVENFSDNYELLKDYDWVILPVVNPDGYEYTHTNSRMWRKTRKPSSSFCYGTDANRNFDFHWAEVGASNLACSDTFRGVTAFSEPETQVLRDLMLSLSGRAKFYLTLHSYGNYLLYPWGWTSSLPTNWKDIDEVAQAGAAAISSSTGTRYTVGSSTNVLYAAAGGSDDYALAVANIPVAICMELPAGGSGFNPTPAQIQPFVSETWIGIKAMAEKVISKY